MGSLMHWHDDHNASLFPFQRTQIWNVIWSDRSGHYSAFPPQGSSLIRRKLNELTRAYWCKQLNLSLSFNIYLWICFCNEKSQQESALSFFMWIIQEYSCVFKRFFQQVSNFSTSLLCAPIWTFLLKAFGKSRQDSRHPGDNLASALQEKTWNSDQM